MKSNAAARICREAAVRSDKCRVDSSTIQQGKESTSRTAQLLPASDRLSRVVSESVATC